MRLEIVHRDISDIYIYETRRLLGVQKEDIVRSIELKIGWRISFGILFLDTRIL